MSATISYLRTLPALDLAELTRDLQRDIAQIKDSDLLEATLEKALFVQNQKSRAYITRGYNRYEVIVNSAFTDANGVLVARVQYLGDLLDHAFDIDASKVEVEFTAADAAE